MQHKQLTITTFNYHFVILRTKQTLTVAMSKEREKDYKTSWTTCTQLSKENLINEVDNKYHRFGNREIQKAIHYFFYPYIFNTQQYLIHNKNKDTWYDNVYEWESLQDKYRGHKEREQGTLVRMNKER